MLLEFQQNPYIFHNTEKYIESQYGNVTRYPVSQTIAKSIDTYYSVLKTSKCSFSNKFDEYSKVP